MRARASEAFAAWSSMVAATIVAADTSGIPKPLGYPAGFLLIFGILLQGHAHRLGGWANASTQAVQGLILFNVLVTLFIASYLFYFFAGSVGY